LHFRRIVGGLRTAMTDHQNFNIPAQFGRGRNRVKRRGLELCIVMLSNY
jgi:hypothetical protein